MDFAEICSTRSAKSVIVAISGAYHSATRPCNTRTEILIKANDATLATPASTTPAYISRQQQA